MSLTEPTTSHAFEDVTPLGDDARRAAESPTTWNYLRSLSGAPTGAPGGPEWADDERLDELFSAWAKAALAADVVTDRGGFTPVDEPTWTPPAPTPEPEVPARQPVSAYTPYEPPSDPAYEPPSYPAYPAGDDLGAAPLDPEALPVWNRDDDEIIPRPRRRGRWGLRRR